MNYTNYPQLGNQIYCHFEYSAHCILCAGWSGDDNKCNYIICVNI
jgi:hypothetical protein